VTREEARERLIKFCHGVRRNNMRRITVRRQYNAVYKNVPLKSLLEASKIEFIRELELIGHYKEKLESEIGEPIGKIVDPDGRQI
jgi:hypothetical protein